MYKVLRTVPGAHNHYHHYQSHAIKQKPKIQNQQNNQYSCNKYPKSIFFKRCTSQSRKILTTLSPALFLEKGKGKRKKYSLEFEEQQQWSNHFKPLGSSDPQGKLPCLNSQSLISP